MMRWGRRGSMILWPFFDDLEETAFHRVLYSSFSGPEQEEENFFFDYIESSWRGQEINIRSSSPPELLWKGVSLRNLHNVHRRKKLTFRERESLNIHLHHHTAARGVHLSHGWRIYVYKDSNRPHDPRDRSGRPAAAASDVLDFKYIYI